ncbi:MAG: GTP 3',8-cyclase MoaA [Hydrogenobaculum sp.]
MEALNGSWVHEITYLRISITDKCNMKCSYCRPTNVDYISHKELLSYEEIRDIVSIMKDFGLKKVRITGGEPLVRPQVWKLVSLLKAINLESISMTTNGTYLKEYAKLLKEAGLDTINISLDTLDEDKFKHVTKSDIKPVLEGIYEASSLGFNIKLNTVLIKNFNDDEIIPLVEFARDVRARIRFIELMPVGKLDFFNRSKIFYNHQVFELLEKTYGKLVALPPDGSKSARRFLIKSIDTEVGFISPISSPFCDGCSKLRLTPEGTIMYCLRTNGGINIKKLIREEGIEAFRKIMPDIITQKNLSNEYIINNNYNFLDCNRAMTSIGG